MKASAPVQMLPYYDDQCPNKGAQQCYRCEIVATMKVMTEVAMVVAMMILLLR